MNEEPSEMTDLLENLSVCQSLVRNKGESLVAIRLQTTGFEIVADCDLGGQRMSDVLNQSISDYLECTNASLYRDGHLIDQVDHVKIRKPEIMLAGIAGNGHEAKQKRIGSRRNLEIFQAFVAVDRWVIRGRLYLSCQKTVKEFLHSNRDFFPIAEAHVIDAESPESPCEMSVAIVNRSRVSFMEIGEMDESEASDDAATAISAILREATESVGTSPIS